MLHLKRNLLRSLTRRSILAGLLLSVIMAFYCLSSTVQINIHRMSQESPCLQTQNETSNMSGQESHCVPKTNLMFMKTHKTASSTLLNILFRFGDKHHLKFALPDGRNDFFYPSFFHHSHVRDYRPGACFNVIGNHMRFNRLEAEQLLPPGAAYFTILRDPAEVFESSFHYYHRVVPFTWFIPGDDKLTAFLEDPAQYYDPDGFNSFYLKNLLLFDFGYDNLLEANDPHVTQAIQEVSERFQLVLLAEHFEESLILLKDALCWEMEDLLFLKFNVRKGSSVSRLSPALRAKALRWNSADWRLYRHFNNSFWAKVEAYGRHRMERDVKDLRRRNAEMRALCVEGGAAVDPTGIKNTELVPWQPMGEKSIMGYNLRKDIGSQHAELCRKMLTPEIQYLSELGVNLWVTRLWGWLKDSVFWLS
ncbi:galactosylceramide sulfotransferase isoform X1 [Alosa pseudoharengus]|uniref:galactosylceramide sulfotransferase isoform X1 n=2 Tax=Alosa pseudoharengus TaxID=34774 RepID=UPI003F88D40E